MLLSYRTILALHVPSLAQRCAQIGVYVAEWRMANGQWSLDTCNCTGRQARVSIIIQGRHGIASSPEMKMAGPKSTAHLSRSIQMLQLVGHARLFSAYHTS